jgi:hypothetical protein
MPGALAAVGPTEYRTDFAGQGPIGRLIYPAVDGHIWELAYDHRQAIAGGTGWSAGDLNARAGGGDFLLDQHGGVYTTVTFLPGQGPVARVIYRADNGHIWELAYDPRQVAGGGTGWSAANLTIAAGGTPNAEGLPHVYVTDFPGQGPIARVVYRAVDGHVWELAYDHRQAIAGGTGWSAADLNARAGGGANAQHSPIGTVTDLPGQGRIGRVVYRAVDGHVWELAYDHRQAIAGGTGWSAADLNARAGGGGLSIAPHGGGSMDITDFPGQGPIARVTYQSTDHHVWEIAYDHRQVAAGGTGWSAADLTLLP